MIDAVLEHLGTGSQIDVEVAGVPNPCLLRGMHGREGSEEISTLAPWLAVQPPSFGTSSTST